jgi:hypothetical protein
MDMYFGEADTRNNKRVVKNKTEVFKQFKQQGFITGHTSDDC